MSNSNIPWRKIVDWTAWYVVYLGCVAFNWWLASPVTVGQQAVAIMSGWFIASVLYGICLYFRPEKTWWKYSCSRCDFTASGTGDLEDMYTIQRSHIDGHITQEAHDHSSGQ